MGYSFEIVPAVFIDSKDIMNLKKSAEASQNGYYVTSNNIVHKSFLDKLFNSKTYPKTRYCKS